MDFKLTKHNDPRNERISFQGEFSVYELARLNLGWFDRALLADVDGDPLATAADYLLGLEMIFRREEQRLKALKEAADEHA